MALVKCKQCGHQVASSAKTCPSCGVSNPGLTKGQTLAGVAFLIVLFLIAMKACSSDGPPAATSTASSGSSSSSSTCKIDDLPCRRSIGAEEAAVLCPREIEKRAKHEVKWIDGIGAPKFSHGIWTDKPGGTITYAGDSVMFQNGFGAFTRMTYMCELSADNTKVLWVDVHEGRLP